MTQLPLSLVWILRLLAAYLAAGLAFAIPFAVAGAGRLDPAARHGSWGFRLAILPGSVIFWPLLLLRWIKGNGAPPREGTAHKRSAEARR